MPWLIQHKCNMGQSDLGEYAITKLRRDGEPFTRVSCSSPECREEFILVGHEMFDEAVSMHQAASISGHSLPPGFVIPRSSKQ